MKEEQFHFPEGKMPRKVIFLDFDGVLNTEKYVSACGYFGVIIDPARMVLLKQIVDATGAQIVLSTSWREHWSEEAGKSDAIGEEIDRIFAQHDLAILDKTDAYSRREVEIEMWLALHPETTAFVVLDDRMLDSPVLRGHFVKTSGYSRGLDEMNVKEAIRILNN